MKLEEVKEILKADLLVNNAFLDETVQGAGGADLMDDVLAAAIKGAVLLTGLTTEQVIRTAKVAGVTAIVFVRGKNPNRVLSRWRSPMDCRS